MVNIYNHTHYFHLIKKYQSLFDELFIATNEILKIKKIKMIDINFVSTKEIKQINNNYRQKNKITDVISFAFDEGIASEQYLGELYICYKVAKKQAKQYHHQLIREVAFLFVHGLLHLYGYDHINKKDEKVMFRLQDKILSKCKIERI